MKQIGNSLYDVCPRCAKLVRLNKPLLGGIHVCVTDEEEQQIESDPELSRRRVATVTRRRAELERSC